MAFEKLPDESRIWVYGFDRSLNNEEYNFVKERLEKFKEEWMYHGSSVSGDYDILENQFVILATNEAISGCSIDSSVAVFKELKYEAGLDALNQNLVYYRDNGNIKSANRSDFQELVNNGIINEDSKVFNLMINHLGSFKNGDFETTFKEAWHSKVFKIQEAIN